MIAFLHEKVKIETTDGECFIGVVVDYENDFETDSGFDEITIQREGIRNELTFETHEIVRIELVTKK